MQKLFTIIHHSKPWSYLLLALITVLGTYYALVTDHTDTLWQWIDPVAGIMTFGTTLVIFGMQAKTNWENSLEKLLTIEYVYTGDMQERTIARIENAYLSGEADIRPWAQQLGGQIMGNLDLDMNWDESERDIIFQGNQYFNAYSIKLYITSDPSRSEGGQKKISEFLNRRFKHSQVSGDISNLPIIWKRFEK